jgi:hypothetical protein
MKLLTKENLKALPALYSQDGKGLDAVDVKHEDLEGALVVLQQERGYMKRVQADQAKLRQGGK